MSEEGQGLNIGATQSMLHHAEGGGGEEDNFFAIMNAVFHPLSKMSGVSDHIGLGIEKAVTSLGMNFSAGISIMSQMKGSILGFPALIEAGTGGGLGDGDGPGMGEEAMHDASDLGHDQPDQHYDDYPHANDQVSHAAGDDFAHNMNYAGDMDGHDHQPVSTPGIPGHHEGMGIE